jgi:hypothetical protein
MLNVEVPLIMHSEPIATPLQRPEGPEANSPGLTAGTLEFIHFESHRSVRDEEFGLALQCRGSLYIGIRRRRRRGNNSLGWSAAARRATPGI